MHIISQALNPPGESIDSKLPLEGAIRQAAPLAQQGNRLIHHRDKVHRVSSLPGVLPVGTCAAPS